MVADRLSEAIKKIESLEEQISGLREARNTVQTEMKELEMKFGVRLDAAAKRLEALMREIGK